MRIELSGNPVEVLRRVLEKYHEVVESERREVTRLEQEIVDAKANLVLAVQGETRFAEALAGLDIAGVRRQARPPRSGSAGSLLRGTPTESERISVRACNGVWHVTTPREPGCPKCGRTGPQWQNDCIHDWMANLVGKETCRNCGQVEHVPGVYA